MIRLRDDIVFEDPDSRIREYCAIEIYRGYDDRHNIDDIVSPRDIESANNLYAMINRYDNTESRRLLSHSNRIRETLAEVPNKDIFAMSLKEWTAAREKIKASLGEFLSVKGIGLAKATKILHLKRPNLFPVLDSFVIKFLLNINISELEKNRQLETGLNALESTREIMLRQEDAFKELVNRTRDLPIRLTAVRIFDILCWTTEKWDVRGSLNGPYGTPHKSLLHPSKQIEPTKSVSPRAKVRKSKENQFVVFEDLERATGPKVHVVSCAYYQRWLKNQTKTTTWHGPFTPEEKAWNKCRNIALTQGLSPSKHNCITR
jgi:hypothetical protein